MIQFLSLINCIKSTNNPFNSNFIDVSVDTIMVSTEWLSMACMCQY